MLQQIIHLGGLHQLTTWIFITSGGLVRSSELAPIWEAQPQGLSRGIQRVGPAPMAFRQMSTKGMLPTRRWTYRVQTKEEAGKGISWSTACRIWTISWAIDRSAWTSTCQLMIITVWIKGRPLVERALIWIASPPLIMEVLAQCSLIEPCKWEM